MFDASSPLGVLPHGELGLTAAVEDDVEYHQGRPASDRWEAAVRARLEETARLREAIDAAYWERNAHRYADRVRGSAEDDPFLDVVLEDLTSDSRVVDVGAGPGRFTLALAQHTAEVVAIDPSSAMLEILERERQARGLGNVRTVHSRLEEVEGVHGDVAICSYVIPLIADLPTFARRLDAVAQQRAFIYMNAVSADLLTEPFWRHFHGTRRSPAPTYLDAMAVLEEIGLSPRVRIVERPTLSLYTSLDEAVSDHLVPLALEDTPQVRAELSELLRPWLVQRDGVLSSPLDRFPAAIISWAS